MEDQEQTVTKEVARGSKAVMNLEKQDGGGELNSKNIASELNTISHRNEERKISEQEIDFLVNEFMINRNKAANLLRKMDLKQALSTLINA